MPKVPSLGDNIIIIIEININNRILSKIHNKYTINHNLKWLLYILQKIIKYNTWRLSSEYN
jgi:hypothetical protein